MLRNVYIVSAARTPIGSLLGSLSSQTVIDLGVHAVRTALTRAAPLQADQIDELYFGNVVSADVGQAPARQIGIRSGLPESVIATTVNKVCSSGLKSIMLGAQTIQTGAGNVVIAGGGESMTNIPHYVPGLRAGIKYGKGQLLDGLERDGLSDAFSGSAMGLAGEDCARQFGISRDEQDEFAKQSYERAQKATAQGKFIEIAPIEIPGKRGKPPILISVDEEPTNFDPKRLKTSRPAFLKENGTITAVNSSKLNDGASAVVLASEDVVKEYGLNPLARIIGFADAEQAPIKFPSTPALAIRKLFNLPQTQGISINDVDFFELNEAFSVVGIANTRLLEIDPSKVNVYGGAVSLGHPLGSSGARIVTTLTSVLKQEGGKYGVAGICNGGGGASALLIENL